MELERPGKKEFVYLQIVQNNTRSIATKRNKKTTCSQPPPHPAGLNKLLYFVRLHNVRKQDRRPAEGANIKCLSFKVQAHF